MSVRAAIAAVACSAALAGSAAAQPAPSPEPPPAGPTVVVLRLDRGPGIDAALSERVQKAIEDQARRAGLEVTPGTENLTDTAAVAGCSQTVIANCKDPIIDALGVDEIVYGSVDRSMSGPHVTVVRGRKGAIPTRISVDVPDQSVDAAVIALQPSLETLFPVAGAGTGPETGPSTGTGPTGQDPGAGLRGPVDHGVDTKKVLFIGGVSLGGAMLVTGLACWLKTSSLNSDIDAAPRDTIDDIDRLRELEDRAGSYAQWGNILVVVGLAVGGGTAAWRYFRGDKSEAAPATTSARIDPWIGPDGGGVVMTWSTP